MKQNRFEFAADDGSPPGYFNTTRLGGDELSESKETAGRQELAVLAAFSNLAKGQELTPWEVASLLPHAWPITSVRRAMTVLTRKGRLIKTSTQRKGPHGKPSYCWRLKEQARGEPRETTPRPRDSAAGSCREHEARAGMPTFVLPETAND